jgi:hypothetical protein
MLRSNEHAVLSTMRRDKKVVDVGMSVSPEGT